ncbi:hypothetical protein ACLB2K_073327 [Fragaria x ananassa]
MQGAARPGKVVCSILRFNNCGAAAAAETLEQRRMVRNPAVPTQHTAVAGEMHPVKMRGKTMKWRFKWVAAKAPSIHSKESCCHTRWIWKSMVLTT